MTDNYYITKIDGWKHMINWITTKDTLFKNFCMNNHMDYILFSGYVPYMNQMSSDEVRLTFVMKQIHKYEEQLIDYQSIQKDCSCCKKN